MSLTLDLRFGCLKICIRLKLLADPLLSNEKYLTSPNSLVFPTPNFQPQLIITCTHAYLHRDEVHVYSIQFTSHLIPRYPVHLRFRMNAKEVLDEARYRWSSTIVPKSQFLPRSSGTSWKFEYFDWMTYKSTHLTTW